MPANMTLDQIYIANPVTTILTTDLFYISQSPYTAGHDAGISGASIANVVQKQTFNYGTDVGAVNALVVTLAYPITSYTDGLKITVLAANTNTNATTINVNAKGVVNIKGNANNALVGGEMVAGRQYELIYSSTLTCFILLNTSLYSLAGDVAGSGPWNNIATTISAHAVTYAKMQQANTVTLLGNPTGVLANIQEITLGAGLSFSGSTLVATASASPLTTKGDIWVYSTTNTRLPVGTIDGQILQVSSGAATGLAYSTATYPATTTINQILYSSAANVVSGITAATNGVLVSNATNVPSFLAGSATSNQALFSNNAAAPGWSAYSFPASITANSLLYGSASNVINNLSSAANGVLVTDNLSVPSILAGPAATGRFLSSNAAAAPSWSTATFPSTGGAAGNILISDGTNYIASTSLWPNTVGTTGKILRSNGTSNAYSTATFDDTYTASNLLYSNGTNAVTGLATANNGLLVTSSGGVPSILAGPGTTGQILQSNAAAAPSFSSTSYPSASALGDIIYGSAANVLSRLTGNITTTKQYLSQTGDSVNSAAPAWATISGSDITGAALTKTDDTNVTLTLGGTPTTALLRAASLTLGWTGQLGLTRGGTNASLTASNGGIFYSTASEGAILAGTATAGLCLLSGASTTPSWSTKPPITQVNVQTFTASGTYTPTTGMKYCTIEVQAGGGGSGGVTQSIASNCTLAGGGGGGGYARKTVPSATIGASQSVTVGAGGTAGANTGTNGGTGGTSSVGSIVSATGGLGGAGAASYATTYQQVPSSGGNGSSGDVNVNGGTGNSAYMIGAGAQYSSPSGGSSYFGGATAASSYGAGITGNTYGAGAAGSASFGAGAATGPYAGAIGGAGIVIITEYISV
jgi:hypothetical protein